MNRYCMLCKNKTECKFPKQPQFIQPGCYTPQTQFCRYCTYLIYGDVPYCTCKQITRTEKSVKSPNRCKEFIFCAMDALALNDRGYRSRGKRAKEIDGQMSLFDFMEGDKQPL